MKNKGIIMSGGKLQVENLAVGDHSKVQFSHAKSETGANSSPEKQEIATTVKAMIARGDVGEAIEALLTCCKAGDNKKALNAVILLSAAFAQNEMQEKLDVISREQAKSDRAKLVDSLLYLIDNEIP